MTNIEAYRITNTETGVKVTITQPTADTGWLSFVLRGDKTLATFKIRVSTAGDFLEWVDESGAVVTHQDIIDFVLQLAMGTDQWNDFKKSRQTVKQ